MAATGFARGRNNPSEPNHSNPPMSAINAKCHPLLRRLVSPVVGKAPGQFVLLRSLESNSPADKNFALLRRIDTATKGGYDAKSKVVVRFGAVVQFGVRCRVAHPTRVKVGISCRFRCSIGAGSNGPKVCDPKGFLRHTAKSG